MLLEAELQLHAEDGGWVQHGDIAPARLDYDFSTNNDDFSTMNFSTIF